MSVSAVVRVPTCRPSGRLSWVVAKPSEMCARTLFAETRSTKLLKQSEVTTSNFATDIGDFLLSAHPDPGWLLIEEGIEPAREHEIELILAIANGYLGTRASVAEGGRFSHPSTFVAGVYVADAGLELGPRLAVFPNWLHVEIAVEDRRLSLEAGSVLEHRRAARPAPGRPVARVAAAGPKWTHHPIELPPACFPRRPPRTPPDRWQ